MALQHHRELTETARAMVAPGRGILAADEGTGTIAKRFASVDVPNTEENRRAYRELLFTTPGVAEAISAVILFEETLGQSTADGRRFVDVLSSQGVVPGIKADRGLVALAGGLPGEQTTEGLDGLRERLAGYREQGARFCKWRATIAIGEGRPSRAAIRANAHGLARYAAIAQEVGLVPIVEPEVLMDGDHTIETCGEVSETAWHAVFHELHEAGVLLEGICLKPNMVLSAKDCPRQAGPEEVAEHTLRALARTVPAAVPGIAFLSGGQSEQEATANLNAMNARGPHPWELSFSYGRALQQSALRAWVGRPENGEATQAAFLHRARLNSAARYGRYSGEQEPLSKGA